MLIRPFSDLHIEFWPTGSVTNIIREVVPMLPTDKKTVAIIAGDLGLAHRQETWREVLDVFAKRFVAVVYVEGNHFFYKNDFLVRIHELRSTVTLPPNVYFLENESAEINDVVFIGATLWTDFQDDHFKMLYARKSINDFVLIRKYDGKALKPEDTVNEFHKSKRFIFNELHNAGSKKTVVVTHHGISSFSVHEEYKFSGLNGAFMTDLSDDIINYGPDLWVHGHTHHSFSYKLGKTRVVVNPYGYRNLEINPQFNKDLVITA